MDLKIKDVAELLNVSETTIRRWLADGKIPAYRIDQQYRFNRLEIEDWLMNRRQEKTAGGHSLIESAEELETRLPVPQGSRQFGLYRAIHKGGVYSNIAGDTKEELIKSSVKLITTNLNLDAEVISEMLLEREAMHSTALNHGIAVPHIRDFLLSAPFDLVTVVFPKNPIPYGALDNQPVHTLFFLFASDDRRHLHLLAKIAHLSSQPEALAFLQTKPSQERLLEHIKNWESSIPSP